MLVSGEGLMLHCNMTEDIGEKVEQACKLKSSSFKATNVLMEPHPYDLDPTFKFRQI